MDLQSVDDEQRFRVLYRRRLRNTVFLWLALRLIQLICENGFGVSGGHIIAFEIASAVVLCAFFVGAFRCTACQGWIKLDGSTCSKCGGSL